MIDVLSAVREFKDRMELAVKTGNLAAMQDEIVELSGWAVAADILLAAAGQEARQLIAQEEIRTANMEPEAPQARARADAEEAAAAAAAAPAPLPVIDPVPPPPPPA